MKQRSNQVSGRFFPTTMLQTLADAKYSRKFSVSLAVPVQILCRFLNSLES
jgi:hypothetical protein